MNEWYETDDGIAIGDPPNDYFIEKEDLVDEDWISHLRGKTWFSPECEKSFVELRNKILGIDT